MSILQTTYQQYAKNVGVFDVIIDLELTVPEAIGRRIYVDRLYCDDSGISVLFVAVASDERIPVACLYSCKTYDIPVLLESLSPGVSGHALLAQPLATGNLIPAPVRVSPALISTYSDYELPKQTVRLITDGSVLFESVLDNDMNIEITGLLSARYDNEDKELRVECNEDIGSLYEVNPDTSYRPLLSINHTTIKGGTAYVTFSTSGLGDISIVGNTTGGAIAYVDSTNLNDALKPVSIIDKYIYYPDKIGKPYSYLPLDDAYDSSGNLDISGLIVQESVDPMFDRIENE